MMQSLRYSLLVVSEGVGDKLLLLRLWVRFTAR